MQSSMRPLSQKASCISPCIVMRGCAQKPLYASSRHPGECLDVDKVQETPSAKGHTADLLALLAG